MRSSRLNPLRPVARGGRAGTRVRARSRPVWPVVVVSCFIGLGAHQAGAARPGAGRSGEVDFRPQNRSHLDHAPYFTGPFATPQAVTRACLGCHPQAASDFMKTSHWQWLGEEVTVPGHAQPVRIGKKNLLNNFCLSVAGNYPSCTRCHPGYGWSDDSFDFTRQENVDCLVCHEHTGAYVKGDSGIPKQESDLLAAAKSVGYPKRENCSVCHSYGGGGQGVKHGDLDGSLENPSEEDDVHMGRYGFLCIDCHKTVHHAISGRAFSVSVENDGGIDCADCHRRPPHQDQRLNAHLGAVACQTCHIPVYARKLPTKTFWDWSKAGDPDRAEDPHRYLKIKGEFVYDTDVVPEYRWFNLTMERYLMGDPMDPSGETDINRPRGDLHDPAARIRPFKVHRALQPCDVEQGILLPPITGGEGGFWHDFNWDQALRLGAKASGLSYSGEYGFARTKMFWPLSHMVAPKGNALECTDCHGEGGRMDWKALGYEGDPIQVGGRR